MAQTAAERAKEYRRRKRDGWQAPRRGWVYVLHCDGFYKIGISTSSPDRRARNMQTGNPHLVSVLFQIKHEDIDDAEKRLHVAFNDRRVRGEWFKLDTTDIGQLVTLLGQARVDSKREGYWRNIRQINASTYDVRVVCDEYDEDDVRADSAVPGDPAYQGVADGVRQVPAGASV